MSKSYSELMQLPTFIERYRYLKLDGTVGEDTFGFRRWLNQVLYNSPEWKSFRREINRRDGGCDLGMPGFEIYGAVVIHHINPITYEDVLYRRDCLLDPENAISTQLGTHNAIHYGDESLLNIVPIERSPNDTCPWRERR
jgi:hypothetical protein